MAETRVAAGNDPAPVPAEPKKKSPVRTLILFGILLLVIGAYAHDYFIAAPAAQEAHDTIQKLVDDRNAQGVKAAKLVNSEDIQAAIGKAPSKVDKQKDYTIEVYRYWGGMMPQRQYISVLYLGDEEPRRHHVHYLNSMPHEDDYPSETKIPEDSGEKGTKDDGPVSGSSAPPGVRSETEGPTSDEAPAPGDSKPQADDDKAPTTSDEGATESPAEPSTTDAPAESETAPE